MAEIVAVLFGGVGFAAIGFWQMFSPRNESPVWWAIGAILVAVSSAALVYAGSEMLNYYDAP